MMRPQEIQEALQNLDDQLILETEARRNRRTALKKRGWRKCWAAAACLSLGLAALGLWLAAGPGAGPQQELPLLPLWEPRDSGAMGFEGYRAYDVSELINGNPWREVQELDSLPVFSSPFYNSQTGEMGSASRQQMEALLLDTAQSLGMDAESLSITDDAPTPREKEQIAEKLGVPAEEIPEEYLTASQVRLEDLRYRVSVDSALSATVEFKEPPRAMKEASFEDSSCEDLVRSAQSLGEQYALYVDMREPQVDLSGGDYNIYGQRLFSLSLFEGAGSPANRLVNYHFDYVTFYWNPEDAFYFSRKCHTDLSQKLGDYPVISSQEALELLKKGRYLTTVPEAFPGDGLVKKTELVYRNGTQEKVYMPYYRFYVELPSMEQEDGMKTYGAYYVPAVESQYLQSLPVWDGSFN